MTRARVNKRIRRLPGFGGWARREWRAGCKDEKDGEGGRDGRRAKMGSRQGGTVAAPEGGSRREGEGGRGSRWGEPGGLGSEVFAPLPPSSMRRVYLTSIATSPAQISSPQPCRHSLTHVYVCFSFRIPFPSTCAQVPQHRKQSIDVPRGRLTDATDGGAYAARLRTRDRGG